MERVERSPKNNLTRSELYDLFDREWIKFRAGFMMAEIEEIMEMICKKYYKNAKDKKQCEERKPSC